MTELSNKNIQICFYIPPFGIIPAELSETYPLSQYNLIKSSSYEIQNFTVNNIKKYLNISNYKKIILLSSFNELDVKVVEELQKIYNKNSKKIRIVQDKSPWSQEALNQIIYQINTK